MHKQTNSEANKTSTKPSLVVVDSEHYSSVQGEGEGAEVIEY